MKSKGFSFDIRKLTRPNGLCGPDIKEELQALVAKVAGRVSKNTDYVVVDDDAGSKLTKAQDPDVTTLDEAAQAELLQAGI